MAADWFYQDASQVVGPLSAKELKWLASRGSIKGGTLVRRGASGDWFAAEKLAAVLEPDRIHDDVATETTGAGEWYFTRDGRKLGPVPFPIIEGLARAGRLKSTDTIRSPEMAEWTPADQVEGLFEAPTLVSDPPAMPEAAAPPGELPARRMPSRSRLALGTAAILLVGVAAGLGLRARSAHRGRSVVKSKGVPKAVRVVDPPPALAAIENLDAADRIVEPAERTPANRDVSDRIARSIPETVQRPPGAARRRLEAAPKPLAIAGRPQVGMVERGAVQAVASPLAPAASIDAILNGPGAFLGRRFILEGVFKVGTHILDPTDKSGSKLGPTISVARGDDRTVCSLEGKVHGRDLHMVLDVQTARNLDRMFRRLRIEPVAKPTYKSILGVRVAPGLKPGDDEASVIVIESIEILGSCDYYLVASRTYANAFKVAIADASGGRTGFGDGEKWLARLGGEEKFVAPIRRKLRDLRRRIANDASGAVVDPKLRRELDGWLRRGTAIRTINAIQPGGFVTGGR